jgi:hypothetical protein
MATAYLNGIEHGFLETVTINNGMKQCTGNRSGLWQCPGHPDPCNGGGLRCCFYVHKETGVPAPCRNEETV